MPLASSVVRLSGWGRYPVAECALVEPHDEGEVAAVLADCARAHIARGNGRSYGDSALWQPSTMCMRRLDRMLAFDESTGEITCEGGVMLSDIIDVFVPRGWFPPVTPGTKYVTIGGMIAADVHGKNHHRAGSFGDHVQWIDLALDEGVPVRCSRAEHPDLFAATCGGMGLTGAVVRAAFRLIPIQSAAIRRTIVRAPNVDAAIDAFERSVEVTYSVAWIDCLASGRGLGRSVLILGEHATPGELTEARRDAPYARAERRTRRVPVDLPAFALSGAAVRLFNLVYYRANLPGTEVVDLEPYLYPLDALTDWNRIYGRAGFTQYQCVIPLAASRVGLVALLREIARAGTGSFLAVLKRLGCESFGYMSFPMEGYTLALDFPITADTLALLDRLDAIVGDHGGRIYLAKDARASAGAITNGYPRLRAFQEVRRRYGLHDRFRSMQSQRLAL